MSTTNDTMARPVAYVQCMGSYQGVPHYGCLLTIEAAQRMKLNDPLYGQAELNAVMAAERERCVHLAGELQWLRNHVAYWSRAGIDGPALERADAALREWA